MSGSLLIYFRLSHGLAASSVDSTQSCPRKTVPRVLSAKDWGLACILLRDPIDHDRRGGSWQPCPCPANHLTRMFPNIGAPLPQPTLTVPTRNSVRLARARSVDSADRMHKKTGTRGTRDPSSAFETRWSTPKRSQKAILGPGFHSRPEPTPATSSTSAGLWRSI